MPRKPARVAVVFSPSYTINMQGTEKLHSFDTKKYQNIADYLASEGIVPPAHFFVPPPASREQLLVAHEPNYLDSLVDPGVVATALEFPPAKMFPSAMLDAEVLAKFRHAVGGTILAARLPMTHGIAISLGGGYHHAFSDHGEGFCVYNDLAIAVKMIQEETAARRIMIIDVDAHHGNGTARIFLGNDSVFCFDMYERAIYPSTEVPGDVMIPLPSGMAGVDYLATLRDRLPPAINQARPDLILLQAGCDVYQEDPLATLQLTQDDVIARDQYILAEATRRHIPIAMTLGGGYSPQAWKIQATSIRQTITTFGLSLPIAPGAPGG